MIGPNNNVESITPPTVTITDDDDDNNNNNNNNNNTTTTNNAFSNDDDDDSSAAHRRPTLTLQIHPNEPNNNNFLRIDCSAAAAAAAAADSAASPINDINAIDSDNEINGTNCMCFVESGVNLNDIPISALQSKSRSVLSNRLNGIKVILSENGSPRDWRGVLNSIGLSDSVNMVHTKMDPMKEVLELWLQRQKVPATIGNLQQILGIIDRWDVFDDTNDYFAQDAKTYLDMESKKMEKRNATNQTTHTIENVDDIPIDDDSNLLTKRDVDRARKGEPPIQYDAYLLYENSDAPFAAQLFHKMKDDYGLELCQNSDLMIGVMENDAIMRMISERCNRLIVIFSKSFFESASNTFFVKFAQAISLEQRKRKIIPIITEECDIPSQFTLYHKLRYRYPEPTYFNFWERLYESVQNVTMRTYTPPTIKVEPPQAMPHHQQAINDSDNNSNTLSVKGKYRSKSPRSSPTTPTSEKKRFWSFPKIGSQTNISSSMLTLDTTDQIYYKENERCHSSLSLNNNSNRSSPIPSSTSSKKNKWLKKLLSPSSGQKLSGESDSSVGPEGTTKKKKWYRKRFHGHSKTREAVAEI